MSQATATTTEDINEYNQYLNLEKLIEKVEELKSHWVGKFLAKAYISAYRGRKSPIDLRLYNSLDQGNKDLFIQILNMRNGWLYSDEQLYQGEQKLKQIVNIK